MTGVYHMLSSVIITHVKSRKKLLTEKLENKKKDKLEKSEGLTVGSSGHCCVYVGVRGISTHANNKRFLCAIVEGDLFRSARSSFLLSSFFFFFFLLSSFFFLLSSFFFLLSSFFFLLSSFFFLLSSSSFFLLSFFFLLLSPRIVPWN